MTLACSALVMGGALGLVGLRIEQVQLAYRQDALRAERVRAEEVLRKLQVEVATLRAPGRVESRARQLGMTAPAREQVRLAREFVAGSTGAAGSTAERSHLASVSGHPRSEPISRPSLP
jgi:cell division protein FtsL